MDTLIDKDGFIALKLPPSRNWEEPFWNVEGILPEGLALLAGRPKVGKTWLALQIATAVAAGGLVLDRKANQGRVLYLYLEGSERQAQGRLAAQRMGGGPIPEGDQW